MSRRRKIKLGSVAILLSAVALMTFLKISSTGNAVAVYNGKVITQSELDKEYNAYFAAYDIPASYKSVITKFDFLNQTILYDLIYDNAVKQGYLASTDDAEKALISRLAYQNKSLSSFKESLKSKGVSYEDIISFLRKQITIGDFLNHTLFQNLTVSDSEALDFYNSHTSYFEIGEKRRISHILVNSSSEAESIIKQLDEGADFALLAKTYSTGPSASNGGDLGYISEGQTIKEFEDAAFSLASVGDYTHQPVHTQYGYHIIKLTGIMPAHNISFEDAKAEIKSYLLSERQREAINNYTQHLLSLSHVEIYLKQQQPVPQGTNIPKSSKPTVELFVMSYCPYGTQAEKGIIPAIKALGNSVDFKLRFVYYSMHGWKELQENLRQYCVQKEHPDKLFDYLSCFLNNSDSSSCLAKYNLNVSSCMESADKEFNNTEQSSLCNIDKELNQKYGVSNSPTLVINGVKASPSSRSPAAYLALICSAFTSRPSGCSASLPTSSYSPGFGYSAGSGSSGSCS